MGTLTKAVTTLTRSWLTRSFKPFEFTNKYSEKLDYINLDGLGLYIHIPFCKSICPFCPYCKEIFSKEKCDKYIDALISEIHLVGGEGEKKRVTSLYFGGGSPALAIYRLKEIFDAVNEHFIITDGIGLELHPSDATEENLLALKALGVTKISIGIQSFQEKFLDVLERGKTDYRVMLDALKTVQFETVSMDFIFALPGQTAEDLKADIEMAFKSGANHFAMYPFIDFTYTASKIKAMEKKQKHKLLDEITQYCAEKGYNRDSIWTFANSKTARYSSMTRDNFLGFGCSATTLLKGEFKINTFSIEEYASRIAQNKLPTALTINFTPRQRMVYYLFWEAYSTKVNPADFKKFFGVSLGSKYGFEFFVARLLGFIKKQNGIYAMTAKGAFYYHYYEQFYTLSYINKMWSDLRQTPFPKELKL